jgi:hypothetical protein
MTVAYGNLPALRYYDPRRAYPGYTLFSPMGGKKVWLVDMEGRIVHHWSVDYTPGCHGRLLPNGNLLYAGKKEVSPIPDFGGSAGIMLEFDWNGSVIWTYEDDYLSHDFDRMENGNTMLLKWAPMPKEAAEKVKGGVPGTERKGVMWTDVLHEVNPKGEVVWEWLAYQHFDPEIDVICPLCPRDRWGQANACHVMPDGNILVSYAFMSMIEIVDKKSGGIIWRWGMGHELGFQHNPTVLDNGNILVFDNGRHRQLAPDYSRVIEINPKTNEIEWEYQANPPTDFYSSFIGGAQRLPNGNTLICEGQHGRFFEVTPDCDIVWEYVNPFYNEFGRFGYSNMSFRAYRYGIDYPGLKGTGLDDINLFYALKAAPSVAPEFKRTVRPGQKAPSAGGKSDKDKKAELKKKMHERLGKLGY